MTELTRLRYFAYGSNMSVPRLRARVPGAVRMGNASLPGYELRWHKLGADGSGKCDLVESPDATACVHGVLFELDPAEKPALDAVEGPRYIEEGFELQLEDGSTTSAFAYVVADKSSHTDPDLLPFCWYKRHVLHGARSNALPEEYIEQLDRHPHRDDHDAGRVERELAIYREIGEL